MCERAVKRHPENPVFPFCSPRCKLADLGNWLDERYVLGDEPAAEDGEKPDPRLLN